MKSRLKATQKCTRLGSKLVSINSREKQLFVTSNLMNDDGAYYIGLQLIRNSNGSFNDELLRDNRSKVNYKN